MKTETDLTRRRFLQASGAIAGGLAVEGTPGVRAAAPADGEGVTRRLAAYIVQSRASDIPAPVRKEAARSVVNYVGCALGGCRHETVDRALAALAEFSGPAQASVFGRRERLDALHAALMNGIGSHVLDFDDTHLETIIHPAGPVASALFALAERRPVGGEDFLHAFILGVETECRIGRAVYPSHYDAGWHITGTAGVFGAAAASGKLLGLEERQMTWALGIAATQAAGLREMFGTMCKSLHPGRAAQNGLAAALLASKSFTSSEQALEAPRGFAHVLSSSRSFSAITEKLGSSFEISSNTYKPFPCGIVIHPSIDGCLQLREEHGLSAEAIESVSLRVHPLVLELTGKQAPSSGLEGKFSIYHACAAALVRGAAGLREFSDEVVRDPEVVALRTRVTARAGPAMREDEARVEIRLRDGRVLSRHVEHAVGSAARPMTDAELEAKFRGLAEGVLPAAQRDRVIAMCWKVASLEDAGALARATVPA
jgi:2-methylcitrate dehydratase PrpD